MPVDILLLGMVAAGGYAALGETDIVNPSHFAKPFNNATNIWPLADYVTRTGIVYHPVVSSPYGTPRSDALDKDANGKPVIRKHMGADIMYKRRTKVDMTATCPKGTVYGSEWHFIPEPFNDLVKKTPVYAVADALVWNSSQSERGWNVVLDHGKPWATYYQHMTDCVIPATSHGKGARQVKRGDVIGYVSGNPVQKPALKHLHFEVWKNGGSESAIDPEPLLLQWQNHHK